MAIKRWMTASMSVAFGASVVGWGGLSDRSASAADRPGAGKPRPAAAPTTRPPGAAAQTRPAADEFFTPEPEAKKIVYLVDMSGTMAADSDAVKKLLATTVGGLKKTQAFNVIYFNNVGDGPHALSEKRLMDATPANVKAAADFIGKMPPTGTADPLAAIKRAFAFGPDVVYFVTDGQYSTLDNQVDKVVDALRAAKAAKPVRVHIDMIARDMGDGPKFLKAFEPIAEESKGTCRGFNREELNKLVGKN